MSVNVYESSRLPIVVTSAISTASPNPEPDGLSTRQRQVLALMVQGHSNKEIARDLGLSEGTVKTHVAALFGKLGVRRRAAAAVASLQVKRVRTA